MKKDILEALLKLDCYCNKHICDECELCIDGACFLNCESPDEYHTIINSRNTTLHDLIETCIEHYSEPGVTTCNRCLYEHVCPITRNDCGYVPRTWREV